MTAKGFDVVTRAPVHELCARESSLCECLCLGCSTGFARREHEGRVHKDGVQDDALRLCGALRDCLDAKVHLHTGPERGVSARAGSLVVSGERVREDDLGAPDELAAIVRTHSDRPCILEPRRVPLCAARDTNDDARRPLCIRATDGRGQVLDSDCVVAPAVHAHAHRKALRHRAVQHICVLRGLDGRHLLDAERGALCDCEFRGRAHRRVLRNGRSANLLV